MHRRVKSVAAQLQVIGVVLAIFTPSALHTLCARATGGFVLFAPAGEVQTAFGEKLELSKGPHAMIHASGADFDYSHYTYDSLETKKSLLIAYYTYGSAAEAQKEFDRITASRRGSSVSGFGKAARWFPRTDRREDLDVNFVILLKNEIVAVRADKMRFDDGTKTRLSKVARIVVSPRLRGHV